MSTAVIGTITNLFCSINKKNIFEVTDAMEFLFTLYMVCNKQRRERIKSEWVTLFVGILLILFFLFFLQGVFIGK